MTKFTNPLDKIRVASPCSADWNQMYGNERKRLCADCKLNVYNLSDMTRDQAETFLTASEGQLCVRFFRRGDGTVLTKDCPVGWQALKRRVSRSATAAFSVVVGLLGGLFAVRAIDSAVPNLPVAAVPPVEMNGAGNVPQAQFPDEAPKSRDFEMIMGIPVTEDERVFEVEGQIDLSDFRQAQAERNLKRVVVRGERDLSSR